VESGESREDDRLEPRSPYSAAKAAGELLARSYFVTYGLDVVVTEARTPTALTTHPEKLIPLFITNAIDDQQLPLYGDGLQRRDWLYVADHAGAIGHVLEHGAAGETYNLAGNNEAHEPGVVTELLARLGKPWSLVRLVEDRPGHDRRYGHDSSKLAALGWTNKMPFGDGLAATVDWYRQNQDWCAPSSPASGRPTTAASTPRVWPVRERPLRGTSADACSLTGAGGRLGTA